MSGNWNVRAREVMEEMISTLPTFSAIDFRARIEDPDQFGTPNDLNNKIGCIFREYSVAGRIEAVGVVNSTSVKRKGGMNRIWRVRKPRRRVVSQRGQGPDPTGPTSRVRRIPRRTSSDVRVEEVPVHAQRRRVVRRPSGA